jgi:hypothetical protein
MIDSNLDLTACLCSVLNTYMTGNPSTWIRLLDIVSYFDTRTKFSELRLQFNLFLLKRDRFSV